MKTIEELQAVVEELNAVCVKHGVIMFGTCWSEGITGEITIFDAANPMDNGWKIANENPDREVTLSLEGDPHFQGLGEIHESKS